MKDLLGIIPAAGKGLRFAELGKRYPKAILPYKEKPLLIHNIKWMQDAGCTKIIVVVNHQSVKISKVLSQHKAEITASVSLVVQSKQDGLSGAILEAITKGIFKPKQVLIVLGDLLVLDTQYRITEQSTSFISCQPVEDYSRWCMVKKVKGKLTFFDKPVDKPPTTQALSGCYYFSCAEDLLAALIQQRLENDSKINGEYQLSTAIGYYNKHHEVKLKRFSILDFGTLHDYLVNRGLKNSRSFNSVAVETLTVEKRSTQAEKIIAEVNWFSNLPLTMKVFTPRILSTDLCNKSNDVGYFMERVLAPTVRDLWLFLDNDPELWRAIFSSAFNFIRQGTYYAKPNSFMHRMIAKTKARVERIDIPVTPSIISSFLVEFERIFIDRCEDNGAVIHGDLCFSNMMFNTEHKKLTVVDPRGDLYGSAIYDVAKLMHSVVYDYDYIDAELYTVCDVSGEVTLYNSGKQTLKDIFMSEFVDVEFLASEVYEIMMLTASLFLSMIPLHSHNRRNQKLYYSKFLDAYEDARKWSISHNL